MAERTVAGQAEDAAARLRKAQSPRPALAFKWLGALAVLNFVLHAAVARGYGYFRDELYYIACAEHLSLGYVDHPPLSILLLYVQRGLFGDSLTALRFFPALASAALVLLSGMLARELGGRTVAQALAGLAALACPAFLTTTSFYSMNAYEPLFWAGGTVILARIINTGDARLWLVFGAVAGAGLENKYTMAAFGAALIAGLLLTAERRRLAGPWPWLGGGLAFVLLLPNLGWQIAHGWPTLEFLRNAQLHKNYAAPPLEFVGQQAVLAGPGNVPIALAGLGSYFGAAGGRRYRALGWAFVVLTAIISAGGGKSYYLAPAYPLLFAAGAIAIERASNASPWRWLAPASAILMALGGIVTAPLALPILPPQALQRYAAATGISDVRTERHQTPPLPQHLADRFGWREKAEAVARVYYGLATEERERTAIFAQNYGEAAAIDFFGRAYGLPRAASAHNSYWFWGWGDRPISTVIAMHNRRDDLNEFCGQIDLAAVVGCTYCMPYENNVPIFVCRDLKLPLDDMWRRAKKFM